MRCAPELHATAAGGTFCSSSSTTPTPDVETDARIATIIWGLTEPTAFHSRSTRLRPVSRLRSKTSPTDRRASPFSPAAFLSASKRPSMRSQRALAPATKAVTMSNPSSERSSPEKIGSACQDSHRGVGHGSPDEDRSSRLVRRRTSPRRCDGSSPPAWTWRGSRLHTGSWRTRCAGLLRLEGQPPTSNALSAC